MIWVHRKSINHLCWGAAQIKDRALHSQAQKVILSACGSFSFSNTYCLCLDCVKRILNWIIVSILNSMKLGKTTVWLWIIKKQTTTCGIHFFVSSLGLVSVAFHLEDWEVIHDCSFGNVGKLWLQRLSVQMILHNWLNSSFMCYLHRVISFSRILFQEMLKKKIKQED